VTKARSAGQGTFAARVQFEDGWYWAEVPKLPGCVASGRTTEELAEALAESVGMCLVDAREPLPAVTVFPRDGWRIVAEHSGVAVNA
jgi:predicted RNase H-like HicB family nuclease